MKHNLTGEREPMSIEDWHELLDSIHERQRDRQVEEMIRQKERKEQDGNKKNKRDKIKRT